MRTILSIDGGGIRGIIPATVLAHIESRVGPLARHFDLIAGTSTGGIIAVGLTCPKPGTTEPMYSAAALAELYQKRGPEIFHISAWQRVASGLGLLDEKYPAKPIEKVLLDYFADTQLGAALTNVLVSAYDIESRSPFFFKSWRKEFAGVPMRAVARATSAAPTYFEPAQVEACGAVHPLVDGGVFVNNPAMSAYVEATRLFPGEREFLVVAVGTGTATQPLRFKDVRNWGLVGWARPVLDVVFDGVSDAVDYQLDYLLDQQYYRFQAELAIAKHGLGDASPANLDALKLEAQKILSSNQPRIDALCTRLTELQRA
ncbi:MAG TPA: patatin-like phospholipase family protein [Longimicrobiales bacterium]